LEVTDAAATRSQAAIGTFIAALDTISDSLDESTQLPTTA